MTRLTGIHTLRPCAATRNRRTGKLHSKGLSHWCYDHKNGGFYIELLDGSQSHFFADAEGLCAIASNLLRQELQHEQEDAA